MKNKTYKIGMMRLINGIYTLSYCVFRTSAHAIKDFVLCAIKHPILACIILGAFAKMFVTTLEARAERDQLNERAYNVQQRNDTLELLISKPHNK